MVTLDKAKGNFLFLFPSDEPNKYRVMVKKSNFNKYPDGTTFSLPHGVGLPLSQFSTDDLLKFKAQVATELENRMDLDEVIEGNLESLKAKIAMASTEVIALLMRQTLDRIDVVSADEKRAKTRYQILEDELKSRMVKDGMSEIKFAGTIQATYKSETVYSVGDAGWDTVYNGIIEAVERGVSVVDAFSILQKRLTSTTLNELLKQGEELPAGIQAQTIHKLRTKRTK